MIQRIPAAPLALLTLAILAACGGGGGIGSGGTGATPQTPNGYAVGTVNGFGSIFVGGVRCDDTRAKVGYVTTGGAPTTGAADVRLGQQVEITFDPTSASCKVVQALVDPEVTGIVTSVAPLVVAGQTVSVNADASVAPPTVFEGVDGAGSLKAGDRVEVHGQRNAAGTIEASRIERKPATDTWVRVKGTVANVTASQFTIGSLTVKRDGATTLDPTTLALAGGQTVIVWSTGAAAADGSITAKAIRLVQRSLADGQAVRIEGTASNCSAAPCTLPTVDGLAVSLGSAIFGAGTPANVANGASLRVEGTWDAAGSRVVATQVSVRTADTTAAEINLIGMVADYVSGSDFTVRGVPVTVNGSTSFSAGCTVAPGQFVAVRGTLDQSQVVAGSIDCQALAEGGTLDIFGGMVNVDSAAKTFKLTEGAYKDYTLAWDADTAFGTGISAATMANGVRVGLRAVLVNGQLLVKRIVADPVPAAPGVQLFGSYGIAHDLSGSSLTVNKTQMNIVPGTSTINGTVVDGTQVRAWFYRPSPNAPFTALQVTPITWN